MDGDLGPYDVVEIRLRAADTILLLDFSLLHPAPRLSLPTTPFWTDSKARNAPVDISSFRRRVLPYFRISDNPIGIASPAING
jgi:hypothetical protein